MRAVLLHDRALQRAARHHRQQPFAWLSPTAALEQLGDVIFRLPPRYQLPPAVAGADGDRADRRLDLHPERRVRGVEIVT